MRGGSNRESMAVVQIIIFLQANAPGEFLKAHRLRGQVRALRNSRNKKELMDAYRAWRQKLPELDPEPERGTTTPVRPARPQATACASSKAGQQVPRRNNCCQGNTEPRGSVAELCVPRPAVDLFEADCVASH